MNLKTIYLTICSIIFVPSLLSAQKQWTLQECIDYAMENNIELKQSKLSLEQSAITLKQSKASLFPSLSFSTNHNVSNRPYSTQTTFLTNGTMTSSKSLTTYNGSYGLNASWTVWNGGRNYKNVKLNKYAEDMSELAIEQNANSIQEQIVRLYVQILYQTEAVKVSEEVLKASKMQCERAEQMVEIGSLAKVDLAQLTAQANQDEYNLVNTKGQLANYKLQLKELLEIIGTEEFDIAVPEIDDEKVLAVIPNQTEVYMAALATRPEIQSGKLNIESSDLNINIARRGYYPTINLNAGIGTNNASGIDYSFGKQIKTNLSNSIGLSISVPIFDNRQNKSNLEKAKIQKMTSALDLQKAEKELYSTIEDYCLNAKTSQQQYIYAKTNAESMRISYELVSEQFRLGLKNIVELTTGKNNLLQAEQQLIQSKYMTLLNMAMLRFYQGEEIEL